MIVSDNGTEFTSNAILAWAKEHQDRLALHRAGQADAERLLSRASTAGCATSFSTRPCSSASIMPAPRSRPGSTTTTPAAALVARLSDAGGLCRQPHRNRRSAAQPRPAPPIARCSTRATRRNNRRGSNRRWMKVQWQVIRMIGRTQQKPMRRAYKYSKRASNLAPVGAYCARRNLGLTPGF